MPISAGARVLRRLRDEIDGAELERLEDVLVATSTADHDDGRWLTRHHEAQEGEPVHARHLEIERDHVGT